MKKIVLGVGSLCFLLHPPALSQPIDEGPADESAYWILKFPGRLVPVVVLSQTEINFGETEVGKEVVRKLRILNKGYGDLVVKKVYLRDGTEFAIKEIGCTKPLEYGEACEITLVFRPVEPGTHEDTLYILTNDPNNPIYEVRLYGTALGAVVETPPPVVYEEPQPVIVTEPTVYPYEEVKPVEYPPAQEVIVVEETPAPTEPAEELPQTKAYRTWVVKPCDTLWDISEKVYGTPLLWAAVWDANRDQIKDPWIIEVGMRLKVPSLTPEEREKYRRETLRLMAEMADRPLGPKCP
ncbi:MAG: LysM peptidoglycan-binding domain-containing protein [Aquificae bacterium]|nr:LysM peptidoglycan-binding domain-containing protein [Aquificota bacterium]